MPFVNFVRETPVVRSPRVLQMEGIFEVAPSHHSRREWSVSLPLEERPWAIGLILGPSGSGKTTLATELFPDALVKGFDWPPDHAILDGFPEDLGIKDITYLLSSVGFSAPPSWLRPFRYLSNGEQFRVTVARALAERRPLTVLDEFTSVIDRTVAQIGSASVARVVRARQQQFIGVSCHYDIEEWLQPDWIFDVGLNSFRWRELQRRPAIGLDLFPCTRQAWGLFRHHHYLDTGINPGARCFLACLSGTATPVSFTSVLSFPHPTVPGYRGHRTVCFPDYQGVGIGLTVAEFIASCYRATGKPFARTSGNPVVIYHTAKSPNWRMIRGPSLHDGKQKPRRTINGVRHGTNMGKTAAAKRLTASFLYVGPIRYEESRILGIIGGEKTIPTAPGRDGTEGAARVSV